MKTYTPMRATYLLLGVWLTLAMWFPTLTTAADAGQKAPAWQVTTLDGQVISSASLKGKVVLVHFWATWCPPCREEMPALESFYKQHAKDGLEIVGISLDEADDLASVRRFAQPFTFPVGMKTSAQVDGFGRIWVLPLSFLIDRKGVLREDGWTGERSIDAASLDRIVLPLLSGP
jgi:thiol-disulfide isomerase/thioredoxin